MELSTAMVMFFSGVFSHAFLIRIFGIWKKALFYKITFINCLVILRLCENMSRDILKAAEPKEDATIDIIFEHWHKMTLYSIKNAIPDKIWQEISIHDWRQAMALLEKIENQVEEIK